MSDRPYLHIAARRPPEPRLAVRLHAFDRKGGPHGRSRAFRLSERDLDEVIEVLARIERRGSR